MDAKFDDIKNKLDAALADFSYLVENNLIEDACAICKHIFKCDPTTCPHHISGIGCYDERTGIVYEDWKWDCRDFDFGSCDALINTPCHECITGHEYTNWEWRGN